MTPDNVTTGCLSRQGIEKANCRDRNAGGVQQALAVLVHQGEQALGGRHAIVSHFPRTAKSLSTKPMTSIHAEL
jgi:hypothetical protein